MKKSKTPKPAGDSGQRPPTDSVPIQQRKQLAGAVSGKDSK